MGSKERRQRERAEQRRKILDAALEIITREGFAGLSMRKLAERIEYSPASIYLHFKSREEIAQELSEEGFGELLKEMGAVSAGKRAREALLALGRAYVTFGLRHPDLYRLIFMGDSEYMAAAFGQQERSGSAGLQAYSALVELADRLLEETPSAALASRELADLIWTMLHGVVSLRIVCVGMELTPAERLVELGLDALLRTLGSSGPEASGGKSLDPSLEQFPDA